VQVIGGGLRDSFLVAGVAFKKTFSYAGFEQQPKAFDSEWPPAHHCSTAAGSPLRFATLRQLSAALSSVDCLHSPNLPAHGCLQVRKPGLSWCAHVSDAC
jgi:hypothetical protein